MKTFDLKAFSKKISLLMKAMEKNQTEIAERAKISRVSLNRFLHGQSELRLSDFVILLRVLGIDMDKIVQDRLTDVTGEKIGTLKGIGNDIEFVLMNMSRLGKQSYLGHLVAYADLLGPLVPRPIYNRLRAEFDALEKMAAEEAAAAAALE